MPADTPTMANLLPWLVSAMAGLIGAMMLWFKTSIDGKVDKIIEGMEQDREAREDMTASILILSIAIRYPDIDIDGKAEKIFEQIKERRTAKGK